VSSAPFDSLNLAEHVGDDVEAVRANRAKVSSLIGIDVDDVVAMAPVHGNAVGIVTADSVSPVPDVDAMVSRTAGKALLVVGADCSPVILGDGSAGVIAVAHSGWRGIELNVVARTVAAMCELGASVDRIAAVVGPSVCGQCYGVDRTRFDATVAVCPDAATVRGDGSLGLDIRRGVIAQLRECGVQVSAWGGCTFEAAQLFSYRRDVITGRQGAMIAIGR
jgi:YfiH family protein